MVVVISAVFEVSPCDVALTFTSYSPAVVRTVPDILNVIVRETPCLSEKVEGLTVAFTSPDVVKRILSFVLLVLVSCFVS